MADDDLTQRGVAGQGSVEPGQLGAATVKKRRRRRRPRSKRGGLISGKANSLATSAPIMMQEEMKEALDQPRDSVLEMEKERDEAKTKAKAKIEVEAEAKKDQPPARPKPAISFSVISEEKKPKNAGSMTYEAPIFMPSKAKIPESAPRPVDSTPLPVTEPDSRAQPQPPVSAEPTPAPVAEPDPWAQPQPPVSAEPTPQPVTEPDSRAQPQPPVSAEPTPAPVTEPDPWAQPQPPVSAEPIPAPVAEPDPWAQPQPPVSAEPTPAPVIEPDPWAQSQPPVSAEPTPAPVTEPDPWAQSQPATAPTSTPAAPFDDYKSPFDDDAPVSPSYTPGPFDSASVNESPAQRPQEESLSSVSSLDTPNEFQNDPFAASQEESVAKEPEAPIEAEVVSEVRSADSELEKELETPGDESTHESLSKKIEILLAEANLTPRHLKFCCGGVVFVIFVIILAFVVGPKLLKNGLPFFGNDSGDQPVVEDTTPPVEDSVTPPIDNTPPAQQTGPVWVDPSVYSGLLLSEPVPLPVGETGVNVGVSLGEESPITAESQFQLFLSDFEALYNLYYVDVTALLNGSNDRAQTLDDHIQTLRDHYNKSATHYQAVVDIKAQLKIKYDGIELEKQTAETQFFAEMKAFDGPSAEEALAQFVELKQQQVELKAHYFAFGQLEYKYETVLDSLLPRISDLEINREALIAGVQVVDILNSDLDLILSEQEALE
jgi:hypothetical protein